MKNTIIKSTVKLALPATVLLVWWLATTYGRIHPILLPKLESIAGDFVRLVSSGELFHHLLASVYRGLSGFFLGSLLGVLSGILLGWSKTLEDFFDVVINFLRSIPKTALAPLFIVWFGFGDLPKVLLIGLSSYFFTVIPTIEGVKNVDSLLIKSARSMGAKNKQILFWVILPAAMPSIYAGIRLAATTALVVLVFVEILAGNDGLGHLLEQSRENLDMATLFMTLFVLGGLGFLLDWLVRFSEKIVMPWRRGKTISF